MNSMHDAFITLVYKSERDKDNGGGYLIDDKGRVESIVAGFWVHVPFVRWFTITSRVGKVE